MRQPEGLRVLQNDSVQRTLVSAVAQVLITRAATMMWVVERLIADRDLGAYLPAGFRALLCATILGTLPTVASAMSKDAERELIGIWDAEIAAVSINIEQGDKAVLLDKQSTTFHYSVSNDDEITLVGDDPDKKIVFRYNDERLVGTSKDGEVAIFRKRPAKLLEVVGRAIWNQKVSSLGPSSPGIGRTI